MRDNLQFEFNNYEECEIKDASGKTFIWEHFLVQGQNCSNFRIHWAAKRIESSKSGEAIVSSVSNTKHCQVKAGQTFNELVSFDLAPFTVPIGFRFFLQLSSETIKQPTNATLYYKVI